jgi:uncharacterized protein YbaA (DUF1428 family)
VHYVDGYIVPVPKREYGALDLRDCVAEDVSL